MKKTTGVVERVYVKELDKPREFVFEGKKILTTHRYSIKLEGDETWFSLDGNKPSLDFEDDDGNWHPLGAGSEVMIKYEQNGDFRNTKKSQITVLNLVPGKRYEKTSKADTKQGATGVAGGGESASQKAVDWSKKDAGIEAGHAVSNAVNWMSTVGGDELTEEAILRNARIVHAATRKLQQEILSPKKAEEPAKKTAKEKPKAVAEVADDFQDDDIPF